MSEQASEQAGADVPSLQPLRPPPSDNSALVLRAFGDDAAQPLRFFVYQDVIEELVFAARYEDRPYGAILLGGFGIDGGRGFIEITGFTGAEWVDEVSELYGSMRTVSDDWILSAPADPIVGQFVSVPGCGAQVDEESARVHYSLFNIPFQPLIMFDPTSGELSLSARAPRTPLFNAAFSAVAVSQRTPLNDSARSGKRMSTSSTEEE